MQSSNPEGDSLSATEGKLDSIKDAKQVTAKEEQTVNSPNLHSDATTHPLQNKWSMWYNSNNRDAWEPRRIASMTTVEEFWSLYNNLLPPSRIPLGNYHFFKNDIEPTWEYYANQFGGRWTIEFPKSESALMDDLWLWTILALIGEYFDNSEDINGAVVSPRGRSTKLSIWTTNNDEEKMRKIGAAWREALRVHCEFSYFPHNTEGATGSKIPKPLYREP